MQKNRHYGNFPAVKILRLFFLILIPPLLLFSQEPITNIEWIEKNLYSIFDSLNVKESVNDRIVKINFGVVKGEKRGFIKSKLLSYLTHKIPDGDQTNFINFHVEQFNIAIVYEQNSGGFLLFDTYYLRKNRITFIGWIEDFEDKPIQSFNINKVFSEKLNIDNLSQIEESPYSFVKGETKELSFWTNTLEPILVGGSISVIVYLFFSVRS